jgi:hypothetical protein
VSSNNNNKVKVEIEKERETLEALISRKKLLKNEYIYGRRGL